MSNDKFEWTDKLVEKYKNTYYHYEVGGSTLPPIEQFKREQLSKRDWEILEFEHKNCPDNPDLNWEFNGCGYVTKK